MNIALSALIISILLLPGTIVLTSYYLNNNISFDIEEQEIENQDIYIFKRRDKERKTK